MSRTFQYIEPELVTVGVSEIFGAGEERVSTGFDMVRDCLLTSLLLLAGRNHVHRLRMVNVLFTKV